MVNDTCTLIEYIHSQHIIDKGTMEFLLPPKNTYTYLHTTLLWDTQNSQAKLPSPPYCFWVWWLTDHLSAYITHFIQPLTSNLPSHIKDKTFSQPHCKTPTPHTHCPLGHSWCHFLIHKHSTQRKHSSHDSLYGKIEAPTTPKLSTVPYSAHHTRFHPQT